LTGRLLKLLSLVVFIGPVVAAFAMAPVEALGAWRVWTLTLVPGAFVLVAGTVFRACQPFVDAPLRDSAGVWLRKTIDRMQVFGITVAAVDRDERGCGNFFHPASKTIVLDENVHGEHTARAYATAAHELGHALFHNDHPWLSRVLLAARRYAHIAFFYGAALLFGTVVAGDTRLRVVAFAFVALAVVLHALVVVDEAIASALARDVLRDDLGDADQGRIARRHLHGALATYVSILVAYLVPLAAAPWIFDGDAGIIVPGAPLEGIAARFADIGAWIAIAGAAAMLVYVISPWRSVSVLFAMLAMLLALCWTPLLATLVSKQAVVPRWTIALATVPAWSLMSWPLLWAMRRFGGALATDVGLMPMPMMSATIQRVSRRKLAEKEPAPGLLTRATAFSLVLWIVPLAIAWLV
jgi:Zn-dependent membrane protease YugP